MASPRTRDAPWWRHAVVYQVYVRSFADSDGDGIGDLPGVRARLADLVDLGVDAIWLNPFYPSPQADAGYDVSDHRDVDPLFGTIEDLDALVADAHDAGLKVIIDLVPNHTSDQHPWFAEALAAEPGSPARARYLFRDGRGEHGELAPNDWDSVFGGPAWDRVTEPDGTPGQWYLHLFAPEQPDLDWTNPEVRAEFESILRFWLARGVDGFRIDVAHGLAKDPAMPDSRGRYRASGLAPAGHPFWDQDEVHEVYRRWRQVLDEHPGEQASVAEAYVTSPERLALYVRPDELHTAFNFRFLFAPWRAAELRDVVRHSIESHAEHGAPTTWVLSNHDVERVVTRYGGGDTGLRRARAAALLMLALPGSAYVYQGEELGLPEVTDLPDEVLQDPTFERTGGAERGRDGCRVPIPWTAHDPAFGFSTTGRSWLPQPDEWRSLARDAQRDDPSSTLWLYRSALQLRGTEPCLGTERLEWVGDDDDDLLVFRRGDDVLCVVNTATLDRAVDAWTAEHEVLLSSAPVHEPGVVPGDTTVWLRGR